MLVAANVSEPLLAAMGCAASHACQAKPRLY